MLVIAQKLGFADLKSFRASLKTNPKLHPASGEALIDAYRGYVTQMQAKLPELFGRLPKAKLEVVPVPGYLEEDLYPAYYEPGTPDGSRPGRLRVKLTTRPGGTSTRWRPLPITREFPAITCRFPSRRS